MIERYGITELNIEDDNFTAHPKHAKELLREIIRRKLDITWNTPNGIATWTLDEELLDLMVESGLQEIILPFESGDQQTLKEPLRLQKAEEFTADEITEIVQKFSTAHDWSLLRRDPIRFFKVYGYLLKRPVILKEIAYRTLRRFAGRVFARLSGHSPNRVAAPQA